MVESESTPRTRGFVWWGIAALVIVAGFADLARGGETIAPILLTIGYCVLVPMAILKSRCPAAPFGSIVEQYMSSSTRRAADVGTKASEPIGFGRIAQLVRASALHAEGRGFESLFAHTRLIARR
jgi:hypothetical protein